MTRRTKSLETDGLREELVALVQGLHAELQHPELRAKVQALVPVVHKLADLGCSMISESDASSARERILFYMRKYPETIITGDELFVVSGIGEWARRVRELRVQFGWPLISGLTAKDLVAEAAEREDEFLVSWPDITGMKPDHYILLENREDREAAHRWNRANVIRKGPESVREKILMLLRENVGKHITGEELRYVAGNKTEWARRVRELRTELGWPITTKMAGRPNLPVGVYVLEDDRQSPIHDRRIPDPIRNLVLRRDGYHCTNCGWGAELSMADHRHLTLHHKEHHSDGGANTVENLITLCNRCHYQVHRDE